MSYENPSAFARLTGNPVALLVAVVAFLVLLTSTVSIVPETRQGIVLRLSKPNRIINAFHAGERPGETGAGLIATIPFLEDVIWIDKRILDIDMEPQEVLSTDQTRLNVDAYARFRVVKPLLMYQSVRSTDNLANVLKPILGSALRTELGKRTFASLLTPERDQVMDNIRKALGRVASQYGAQIVDVRIKRADLPEGSPLESAFERMKSRRTQEALTIEADGLRQATEIKAGADAEAAQIYAAAFGKDPDFYNFYRAMQSYKVTFLGTNGVPPKGSTSIILSPGNDYLSEFRGGGK
jgi:modulator of FtsH protease HflC